MHPFDGLLAFLSFLELQDKNLDLLMEDGLVLFMLHFFSSQLKYVRKAKGTSLLQSAKAGDLSTTLGSPESFVFRGLMALRLLFPLAFAPSRP